MNIKCVPEKGRAGFLILRDIFSGVVVYTVILFAGRIVDQFKSTGHEMEGLILFRGITLVLSAVDIYLLFHIKEFPNDRSGGGDQPAQPADTTIQGEEVHDLRRGGLPGILLGQSYSDGIQKEIANIVIITGFREFPAKLDKLFQVFQIEPFRVSGKSCACYI